MPYGSEQYYGKTKPEKRTLEDYTDRELKDYIHGLIEAEDYKEAKEVIRLAEKRIKNKIS